MDKETLPKVCHQLVHETSRYRRVAPGLLQHQRYPGVA